VSVALSLDPALEPVCAKSVKFKGIMRPLTFLQKLLNLEVSNGFIALSSTTLFIPSATRPILSMIGAQR
jgi:hypothetical protein